MSMIDALASEFEQEARKTRKQLERLPQDKLEWRPHAKSFTAGALASHIVDCVGWGDAIFNREELDINPAEFRPFHGTSVADIIRTFDDKVAASRRALAQASDATLMAPWRLKIMGKVRLEKPRADVFRDFTVSHVIHHRGQFSVYLRLLDVPVPGAYGPSADEQMTP